VIRQQSCSLNKGDEENAIEQFLRDFDGGKQLEPGSVNSTGQVGKKAVAKRLVVDIQLIGDVFVGAIALAKEQVGRAA